MKLVSKIGIMMFAAAIAITGGCSNAPLRTEGSTSGIRAAEEAGAAQVPQASLYLQMAKEELELAKELYAKGEREEAASMLLGQELGRRHQGGLPAGGDHRQRGHRGHHGLAAADIALHQPQHGVAELHIALDFRNDRPLRLGQRERQCIQEVP